eukprot:g11201.t1
MENTPEQWYKNLPILTRIALTAFFVTTVFVQLGFLDPMLIALNWPMVINKLQVWRLLTPVSFFGTFSFQFLFQMYFFSSFSSKLEQNQAFSQPGDYLFFLLLQILLLDVISLALAWPAGFPFLGPSLVFAILYYWSRREPYAKLSFFSFSIQGYQFPFALLFFQLLIGGNIWMDLLGLASGHIYYFLAEVVPQEYGYTFIKTPAVLTNFMARQTGRGVPAAAQQQTRFQGRGQTLGAMGSSSSKGPEAPAAKKPTMKMCCACPETKAARDECITMNGEEKCKAFIEAHKQCLRSEGFDVKEHPPFAPPPRPDNDGKTLAGEVDEFACWEASAKTPMELRLKSGECWRGWNFGAKRSVAGEVVFCTAMMGYPESLTDPSFAGQILVLTYPLVGNYGVPPDETDELGIPRYFEGSKIYPIAVVVSEYSFVASHYSAVKSLSQWLEEHKVPGIFGVDTRAITKRLRMEGSALGAVVEKPWLSVQFHPEACCGPVDTAFLFDEFLRILRSLHGKNLTTIGYKHPQAITKVLVLGSGGLTIGQAGEFDYSGSQAIKALREQQVQSILINPNIATVQTSKGLADQIFFVPVTPEFVTKVIEKTRPDGLFAAFGGQTALNCAVQLHKNGTLKKYGVKVLGTQIDSIIATEDRDVFKAIGFAASAFQCWCELHLHWAALESWRSKTQYVRLQVIIDECLKGWKELEYEVMRDSKDNCLVVCNMENLDPMGVHTGESIVVAPSQTLSNDEYHKLRAVAIKVIRHFGIVGEANIQYALDPNSKRYRIVEVNARLSRSSALASKATGYPLAYVAAKIALGHDLVSLRNLVTRCTTACFEPSLDYCVVKIPRWDIDKFPTVERTLGTQMKSVGEVMSIARSFPEAMQKALRMVNEGSVGFDESWYLRARTSAGTSKDNNIEEELRCPGPSGVYAITRIDRWFLGKLFCVHQARKRMEGMGSLAALTKAGPQFLRRVKQLGFCDRQIGKCVKETDISIMKLRASWNCRPCVKQVDTLAAEFPAQTNYLYLTYVGDQNDVESAFSLPFKKTPLQRSTTSPSWSPKNRSAKAEDPPAFDLNEDGQKPSFIVLGSGCYRIGASVEFDWSSVSAELTLETVLEICNFEQPAGTIVSVGGQTPNNLAPKLDKMGINILGTAAQNIDRAEDAWTLKQILPLSRRKMFSPELLFTGLTHETRTVWAGPPRGFPAFARRKDRSKFSAMCDELGVDQPEWSEFVKLEEALSFANMVGFPVLVRPSYVLSGAAMRVIDNEDDGSPWTGRNDNGDDQLKAFLGTSAVVEQEFPVVISKYVEGAREIEFDGIGRDGQVLNYAISEHVEDAGTHSGDATLLLPSQRLYLETHRRVMHVAAQLCKALNISGPFNVQFMAQEGSCSSMRTLKVIECNVRASRTVPFVSKTLNVNFIELATRVMLKQDRCQGKAICFASQFPPHKLWVDQDVRPAPVYVYDFQFVSCKAPMFSFQRLSGSDPHVGVEMQSTGEVACFGQNANEAFLKALIASGVKVFFEPCGILLSLGSQEDKKTILKYLPFLDEMGYKIYGTTGTASFIEANAPKRKGASINVSTLANAVTQKKPNVISAMAD